MARQQARACGVADAPRLRRVDSLDVPRHGVAVSGDKYFPFGLQEGLDAFPGIHDQAGPGTASLEHARWRRPTEARHAVAVDVEHQTGAAIERVVIVRRHVSEPA